MKARIFALTIFLTVISLTTYSNDGKYLEAMQKNIKGIYEAQSIEDLQNSVNSFERIAAVEKTKWEPLYYTAFGYLMMSARENDPGKKDQFIDLAFKSIEKAKEMVPGESEIFALEGFAYMMRVSVDPASRGAQYASTSVGSYEKALSIAPNNPRALTLLAQMQYGTAQFFGSSTTEACETLSKALASFESYKSENPLAPQWGLPMAKGLSEKCKG
jgi:hypothetical protein